MGLIKDGQLVQDSYRPLAEGEALPTSGAVWVDVDRFLALKDSLGTSSVKLGVQVQPDIDHALLPELARHAALIAVVFGAYTDGRGYSLARRLRTQYGFQGELRAMGDVLRDQLFYMKRCGFNAFDLKDGKDVQGALEAFEEFSVTYQAAADDAWPLFRRRAQSGE